jgi:hypothetical protein
LLEELYSRILNVLARQVSDSITSQRAEFVGRAALQTDSSQTLRVEVHYPLDKIPAGDPHNIADSVHPWQLTYYYWVNTLLRQPPWYCYVAKGKGTRGSEDTGQAGAIHNCDANDMPNTAESMYSLLYSGWHTATRWCWQSFVLSTCVLMASLG